MQNDVNVLVENEEALPYVRISVRIQHWTRSNTEISKKRHYRSTDLGRWKCLLQDEVLRASHDTGGFFDSIYAEARVRWSSALVRRRAT